MHMADALISPVTGGVMWAATAGLIGYSAKRMQTEMDDKKVPLMGVTGAFIFAAQMINFTIPATGSSGHIGGGMILAIMLGPYAAFLTITSVLIVQALFFADGGLLALGCNIFNMGFFPAFVAYPFIYRPLAGRSPTKKRIVTASLLSAVVSLQLGALGVVMQTFFSGISGLSMGAFLALMQPIHLAIGVVEGIATAAIALFVLKARPEIIAAASTGGAMGAVSIKKILVTLLVAAAAIGAGLSWFASTHPDGLEWSLIKTTGHEGLSAPQKGVYESMSDLQGKTAFMPDYGFKSKDGGESAGEVAEKWPSVEAGTSLAGIIGGGLALLIAVIVGFTLRRRPKAT